MHPLKSRKRSAPQHAGTVEGLPGGPPPERSHAPLDWREAGLPPSPLHTLNCARQLWQCAWSRARARPTL